MLESRSPIPPAPTFPKSSSAPLSIRLRPRGSYSLGRNSPERGRLPSEIRYSQFRPTVTRIWGWGVEGCSFVFLRLFAALFIPRARSLSTFLFSFFSSFLVSFRYSLSLFFSFSPRPWRLTRLKETRLPFSRTFTDLLRLAPPAAAERDLTLGRGMMVSSRSGSISIVLHVFDQRIGVQKCFNRFYRSSLPLSAAYLSTSIGETSPFGCFARGKECQFSFCRLLSLRNFEKRESSGRKRT